MNYIKINSDLHLLATFSLLFTFLDNKKLKKVLLIDMQQPYKCKLFHHQDCK